MDAQDDEGAAESCRFKMRDLRSSKVYRIGAKLWGAHGSRRRILVAPPMAKHAASGERRSWLLKPDTGRPAQAEAEEKQSRQQWLSKRRQLREQLDCSCSVQQFIARKNPTRLEASVLSRLPPLPNAMLGESETTPSQVNCFTGDQLHIERINFSIKLCGDAD